MATLCKRFSETWIIHKLVMSSYFLIKLFVVVKSGFICCVSDRAIKFSLAIWIMKVGEQSFKK